MKHESSPPPFQEKLPSESPALLGLKVILLIKLSSINFTFLFQNFFLLSSSMDKTVRWVESYVWFICWFPFRLKRNTHRIVTLCKFQKGSRSKTLRKSRKVSPENSTWLILIKILIKKLFNYSQTLKFMYCF